MLLLLAALARPAAAASLDVADDLAALGLADDASEEYRAALQGTPAKADEVRARLGIARCAWDRGRQDEALAAWAELGKRFPDEEAAALAAALRARLERRDLAAVKELCARLATRADLPAKDRAEIAGLAPWVEAQLSLAPAVDERFDAGIGARWLLSSPLAARPAAGRGDVEVRAGLPEGPTSLVTPVAWRGEACVMSFDVRLAEVEPGACVRLGLAAMAPPPAAAASAPPGGAPPGSTPSGSTPTASAGAGAAEVAPPERLVVEIAVPDAPAPADSGAPRAQVGLAAWSDGARACRAPSSADPGLALGTSYRIRVEWVPALSRALLSVEEISAAAPSGRTVLSAELPLARPFAGEGAFELGVVAPAGEAAGAPAVVGLAAARLSVPPDVAARAAPPPADPQAAVLAANAALASGRAVEALAGYRAASLADPAGSRALLGMGLAARETGELLLAARAFAAVARTEPAAKDLFRAAADDLAARYDGSPLDLVAALEASLATEPQDAARRAALDGARRRLVEWVDAQATTATALAPEERIARAELYARGAAPEKALAELGRAEADLARLRAAAAPAARPQGATPTARPQGATLTARPQGATGTARPEGATGTARAEAATRPAQADSAMATAQAEALLDARLKIARAKVHAARGDAVMAQIDWGRARTLAPEDPAPLVGIGRQFLDRWLARPAGQRPQSATAPAELLSADAALSTALRLAPAASSLAPPRSAIEIDPRADLLLEILAVRARVRLLLGRAADARADAEAISALAPRDVRGPMLAAQAAFALGRTDEGKALLERARRLGPALESPRTAAPQR